MAEKLQEDSKSAKKKQEVISELEKLKGQDLRVLQGETASLNEELEKLKTEWDEYKKPINEEIFANKQMLNERKVEYQYKNEKIKDLKKDFKKAVEDLEHKKKVHEYMKVEVEKMPKDVNRNQYLKRINEIIKTLKDQKKEIIGVLDDVKAIQKDTEAVLAQTKAIDNDVETIIFDDASKKKDKTAKDIYEQVQSLKKNFNLVITNVQEQNKIKNQIRDVETKNEEYRIK